MSLWDYLTKVGSTLRNSWFTSFKSKCHHFPEHSRIWDLKGRSVRDTVLSSMCPEFLGRRAEVSTWELWGGIMIKDIVIISGLQVICALQCALEQLREKSIKVIFTPCRTQLVQDYPQQPTETQDGETHRGIRHEEHHRRLQQRRVSRRRDV